MVKPFSKVGAEARLISMAIPGTPPISNTRSISAPSWVRKKYPIRRSPAAAIGFSTTIPSKLGPAVGGPFHVEIQRAGRPVFGKFSGKGGLANLSRTEQDDRRILGKSGAQNRFSGARDHSCKTNT